jgi:beta-N-acetylhexosaminidase
METIALLVKYFLAINWRRALFAGLLFVLLGLGCSRSTAVPTPPPLPLQARIGQMLLVCFEGTSLPSQHPLLEDIRLRHLGGVMLRSKSSKGSGSSGNIISPAQLQLLTNSLQTASPTPLLIAVDQEGGRVTRLKARDNFPPTTSFADLGRKNDLAMTRQRSDDIAKTLLGFGINFNFSPVVDLNRNPNNPVIGSLDRSFSPDPARVTAHAAQVVAAHRAYAIATCLKHFPGHGSSTADSHRGFVDVTETWTESELLPFANLIEAGLVDAIMTAHVYNARLDIELPATLSRPILNGLLREKLAYDGVIISDDLRMEAISRHYAPAEAVERAINAGVDILLICASDEQIVDSTVALIYELVQKGRISEQRIDQAYRRISRLKSDLIHKQPAK